MNHTKGKDLMQRIFAVLAVLAAMALAMPVMAADTPGSGVVIGGRISADAGWQIMSGGDGTSAHNATDDTLVNFFTGVQAISYLRATFTSSDKTTGAHIELGFWGTSNRLNQGSAHEDNTAYLRLAYGWWEVGNCKLTVGQAFGRLGGGAEVGQNLGRTKRSSGDLQGYGFLGATRSPRISLAVAVNEFFGFDVSISQSGSEISADNGTYRNVTLPQGWTGLSGTSGSTQNYLPKLELVLDFKFNGFKISPGAGISYQKWQFDERTLTVAGPGGIPSFTVNNPYNNFDDSVLSYVLHLPVKYEQGPFYAVLSAFYGQNVNTDWTGENTLPDDVAGTMIALAQSRTTINFAGGTLNARGEIEDTTMWGLGLGAGYAFTDKFTVKIGAGFSHLSNDAWADPNTSQEDSFTRWAAFIGAPYKVTSNFTIQPEVVYYNYGDEPGTRDEDNGSEWLLGVYFQFLF
jgi:opacity protein-like surface antigen